MEAVATSHAAKMSSHAAFAVLFCDAAAEALIDRPAWCVFGWQAATTPVRSNLACECGSLADIGRRRHFQQAFFLRIRNWQAADKHGE